MGGGSTCAAHLAQALAQHGHQVWVGCPKNSWMANLLSSNPLISLIPIPLKSPLDACSVRTVAQGTRQQKITFILCNASVDRYVAWLATRLYNLNVCLIHIRHTMPASFAIKWQYRLYWGLHYRIIAVSKAVQQALVQQGIAADKISTIYHGIPQTPPPQPQVQQQLKKNLQLNQPVIACLSRLKRQDILLQALSYLQTPIQVLFIGIDEIPAYIPLRHKAEANGHQIQYTGTLDPAAAHLHLSLADIHVLCSEQEGLPQAIREAMLLHIPVIASQVGGVLDIIKHQRTGLLFDNQDPEQLAQHIQRLLSHPAEKKALATRGYEWVQEKFNLTQTVAQYEIIFKKNNPTKPTKPKPT